jgi:hypothetical protein
MMHLGFPNVLGADEFVGCGRYLSLTQGQEVPEIGYRLAEPNKGRIGHLLRAAQNLVPEYNTEYPSVYEQVNEHNDRYYGPSLELAYLLASIRCVRRLRLESLELSGDIWCTGAITQHDRKFFLDVVDQASFDAKLRAFLSPVQDPYRLCPPNDLASEDKVFFVPALNFARTPAYAEWCSTAATEVLSLEEFADTLSLSAARNEWPHKMVVKIRDDKLHLLVDLLFEHTCAGRVARLKRLKTWFLERQRSLSVACIVLVVLSVGFAIQSKILVGYWMKKDGQFVISQTNTHQEKVQKLEQLLKANTGVFDWNMHNELRHLYITNSPSNPRKSMEHSNIILQYSHMDNYVLNILSGWQIDKNTSTARANLLTNAQSFPNLRFIAAACFLKIGDLYVTEGDLKAAKSSYLKVAEDKSSAIAPYRVLAEERLRGLNPKIVRVETFREGVLVFFRVFFTDPSDTATGFGFRSANSSLWAEENHPFSSPSYGRVSLDVSPAKIEYPFNLGCTDTGSGGQLYIEVWINYHGGAPRSQSIPVHLACSAPSKVASSLKE